MAINIPIFSSLNTKGFDQAKKEFQSLEGFGKKAGFIVKNAFLPLAAVGTGVAAFGYKAALAASDLNEEISKSRQIFGGAAREIEAFGETAARSIGQSKQEAVAAASTFGIMGKAAGLTGTDLAQFSTKLVTLSSDLASFNNAKPAEVVQALGAALRGESEPMRRFGVLLNDAALKAEAMAMGIYKGKGPLDQQAKILAANSLILKQTTDAQGDFIRTSDSAANQQRILNASMKDLTAEIGKAFLPALQDILRFTASVALAFSEDGLGGAIKELRRQMQGLTRDSDGTINGFGNFVNALITVRNALAHVLNMFIRLYNVLPFLDDIDTINMVDQLTTNFGELYGALSKTTQQMEKQQKLKGFMGPVASRDLETLTQYQKDYQASLLTTLGATEDLEKASGGAAKKLATKKKSTDDAKKALQEYKQALGEAVESVRDQFSPALQTANDRLAESQGLYNDFYKNIRQGISGIFNVGTAWRDATDAEQAYNEALAARQKAYAELDIAKQSEDLDDYAKAMRNVEIAELAVTDAGKRTRTFFGALSDQSEKAKRFAFNLAFLVEAGLNDPTLLQSIVEQGTDTGLAITESLIAGGQEGLKEFQSLANGVNEAADYVAKFTADRWFKSGVDQATKVVEGVQSVINETEFALKFVVSVEGANQLGANLSANLSNVLAGGAPAPMFNPADFSAAAFAALGAPATAAAAGVRTSSVNINVNGGDPNAVVDALRRYMQTNGSVPIKTTG